MNVRETPLSGMLGVLVFGPDNRQSAWHTCWLRERRDNTQSTRSTQLHTTAQRWPETACGLRKSWSERFLTLWNTEVNESLLRNSSGAASPGALYQDMPVLQFQCKFCCMDKDLLKAVSIHKNKSCAQDTQYYQEVVYINLYSTWAAGRLDHMQHPICTWCVSNANEQGRHKLCYY